ncbi:TIR domain-containing protein [Caulobacter sp.]|uniref:TIR domain-containing protein n=1 Tax=Caulobacter sp. TaxID=78 RepID=UPI001B0600FD|nr:TIR domain-containing protein [Caulobacter sp.]MBO9543879.1 nucleotide-binding protein [Caulobacter sp.]
MQRRVLLHIEDDAYLLDCLVDYVGADHFEVIKADTHESAYAIIEEHTHIDCALIDMMLPLNQQNKTTQEAHVHEYGSYLARCLKRRFPEAYVIGSSKRSELSSADLVSIDNFLIKKDSSRYLRTVSHYMRRRFALNRAFPLSCFIVHGHDHAMVAELDKWLRLNTKFEHRIVLANERGAGLSLIEKFERSAAHCDAVFVLLTRDDRAISRQQLEGIQKDASDQSVRSEPDLHFRSRQNVIFEAGYFLGKFGREQGRVVLLYEGDLELPSDLSGMLYVDISKGIQDAHDDLRRELSDFT